MSTEFNVGLSSDKSSSRVLKPPGGGHSNIFGEPEQKAAQPRPKYDQQNSSNLNFCMNTTDPNVLVQQQQQAPASGNDPAPANGHEASAGHKPTNNITGPAENDRPAQPKGRVPPGKKMTKIQFENKMGAWVVNSIFPVISRWFLERFVVETDHNRPCTCVACICFVVIKTIVLCASVKYLPN